MSRRIESVAGRPPVSRHRAVAIGVVLALAWSVSPWSPFATSR